MHSHDRTLLARLGFADPDKRDRRHDYACQYLALPENHGRLARMLAEAELGPRATKYTRPARCHDLVHPTCAGHSCRDEAHFVQCVFEHTRAVDGLEIGQPRLESALGKGYGQYATTVGFLDVVLPFRFSEVRAGRFHGWTTREVVQTEEAVAPRYTLHPWPVGESQQRVVRDMLPDALRAAFPAEGRECRVVRSDPGPFDPSQFGVEERFTAFVPQLARGWFDRTETDEHSCRAVVEVKIAAVGVGDLIRQINLYRSYVDHVPRPYWIVATAYAMHADDVASLKAEQIRHVRLGAKFEEYAAARAAEPPDEGGGSPEL